MGTKRQPHAKILIASSVHVWNDLRIYYKEAALICRLAPTKLIAVANGCTPGDNDLIDVELLPAALHGSKWQKIRTRIGRSFHIARELLNTDYRVFHFHDPELIFVGWLAKLRGCKVIYDMHEDALHMLKGRDWLSNNMAWVLGRLLRILEMVSGKIFDELILAHEGIGRSFKPTNSSYLLNYPLEQKKRQQTTRTNDEPLKIVYAGALTNARGISDLYHAVDQLVAANLPIELQLYGTGDCQAILDLIAQGQSAGWLSYGGWLPLPELMTQLPHFHLGISPVRNYPNYRHNLLTKVLDYLSVGLPVVSSDLPGIINSMGTDGSIIYFEAGNIDSLAEAIKQLLDEPRRRKAADSASNLVAHYTWASQSTVLEQIYGRYLG